MGWAEGYTEGLQQYLRWKRITLGVIFGAIAAAGGLPMYSDTVHQLTGKPSTATLIEHIKECTVEYQIVGEGRREEPMACDAAEALQQQHVGRNKIKVSAASLAVVRFSLADGRAHEAKVNERKLDSYKLPAGAKIAVVYAPDQPADVRPVLTWDRLKVSLIMFAGGVVFLMLTFAGSTAALFAWAFRRGPAPVDGEPGPAAVVSGRAALPTMASEPRASFGRRK